MKFKYCIYILCSVWVIGFTSCLNDGSESEEITYSPDAEILSFKLSKTSVSELGNLQFTIDQLSGEIYNKDSLAYGVDTTLLKKVLLTYSTAGTYVCYVSPTNTDSTQINNNDSIAIFDVINNPKKYLRVYAFDGGIKDYTLNLRVHTVDPDSMAYQQLPEQCPVAGYDNSLTVLLNNTFYSFNNKGGALEVYSYDKGFIASSWTQLSPNLPAGALVENVKIFNNMLCLQASDGKLYSSTDAIQWNPVTFGGELATATLVSMLGEIKAVSTPSSPGKVAPVLSLICHLGTENVFVETNLTDKWIKGEVVPANFPVKDFASTSWINGYTSNLIVVGGTSASSAALNTVWWTQNNGLNWSKTGSFTHLNSANVFYYNDMLYLMNGNNGSSYNNSVYTSVDAGQTWQQRASKYAPPALYSLRSQASVCVDNSYFYIFGGENESSTWTDIWKAQLNELSFTN